MTPIPRFFLSAQPLFAAISLAVGERLVRGPVALAWPGKDV